MCNKTLGTVSVCEKLKNYPFYHGNDDANSILNIMPSSIADYLRLRLFVSRK